MEQLEDVLTFTGDIVENAEIEVLPVPHLVAENDFALELENRNMRPVKGDAGFVPSRAPSIEDC